TSWRRLGFVPHSAHSVIPGGGFLLSRRCQALLTILRCRDFFVFLPLRVERDETVLDGLLIRVKSFLILRGWSHCEYLLWPILPQSIAAASDGPVGPCTPVRISVQRTSASLSTQTEVHHAEDRRHRSPRLQRTHA